MTNAKETNSTHILKIIPSLHVQDREICQNYSLMTVIVGEMAQYTILSCHLLPYGAHGVSVR